MNENNDINENKNDENDENSENNENDINIEDDNDERARAEKILKNMEKTKKEKNGVIKAFALVTQLGVQMAFCVIVGVLTGMFLDRLAGTSPLFIIVFSILGSAASIKVIFDIANKWKY
ncbi:MAG: AtpZ/AtpI family protein [Oscillospiraceae bacterium]|nr:AtpZ/AtpI family protein [Oscillospiraceae bacterium]